MQFGDIEDELWVITRTLNEHLESVDNIYKKKKVFSVSDFYLGQLHSQMFSNLNHRPSLDILVLFICSPQKKCINENHIKSTSEHSKNILYFKFNRFYIYIQTLHHNAKWYAKRKYFNKK